MIVWFIKPIVRFIDKIFGASDEEKQFNLSTLYAGIIHTPDAALVEVRNEINKMSALTVESYDYVCDILRNEKGNNKDERCIVRRLQCSLTVPGALFVLAKAS